jgi:hypothetical protein
MKVLLYTPPGDGEDAHRLEKVIGEVAPANIIESYRSLQSLAHRLQDVLYDEAIIILFAENKEELLRMKAMRSLLANVPVFLVIPDQGPETIAIAHLLRPRFLISRDGNYADLGAVLRRKMLSENSRQRESS